MYACVSGYGSNVVVSYGMYYRGDSTHDTIFDPPRGIDPVIHRLLGHVVYFILSQVNRCMVHPILANRPPTVTYIPTGMLLCIYESSDDNRHWDDLLSLDHNPDNLFRYRRSMTPTLAQRLRENCIQRELTSCYRFEGGL